MSKHRGTDRIAQGRVDAGGREREPGSRRAEPLVASMLAIALASALPVCDVAAQSTPVAAGSDRTGENDADKGEAAPTELDVIRVTGTRVKGGTVPSPVVVLDAGRIEEEGLQDLGEVIRSIPQNFTGGQNPGAASLNVSGAGLRNQNATGGSSLNLRGLGPDASLTLLNGRRLAYGGVFHAVDISAIPVDAVARVEIVPDGASAIYGSDAVAGVGNVVLKRDHDGVSVGARYGTATDGGLATREFTTTAGTTWASGGLIATYKAAEVDPIRAADRDYTPLLTPPTTVYPGSELDSGLLSIHQALGERAELTLDALKTRRNQVYDSVFPGRLMHVTPETTTTFAAPGIEVFLGGDWSVTGSAAWGRDRLHQVQMMHILPDGPSMLIVDTCYCNESRVYEAGAEGPVASLPAGEVRLAAGAGYRSNEYTDYSYLAGQAWITGRDSSRFAYAELDVPLVSADNARPGIHRLALTAAVRAEDYADFGGVTTPKLGLIYGPSPDVTFRASAGRSFKAPTLFERNRLPFVQLETPEYLGGEGYPPNATVMLLGGGSRDLDPERAKTWSATAAFHPESMPALDAELTWFRIDFTNRVREPIPNITEALSNPVYRYYITDLPSLELQQQLIEAANAVYNFTGRPYDPSTVVHLVNARYINASRQVVRGLDASGSWRFTTAHGDLTLRGSASWMESSEQTRAGQEQRELAGTLFNPPKLRARLGGVWDRGGFTASAFANYSGGVDNVSRAEKGASFTTFDLTLRYDTGYQRGAWSGVQLEFAAQNVFNRAPPLFTPLQAFAPPYDSTNYSAIGRFLGVSVTKHF